MLDEGSQRRLAEMGIEVFVLRTASAPARVTAQPDAPAPTIPTRSGRASVLILADAGSRWASGVITGVERALKFARIGYTTRDACDASTLSGAAGVVVFGEALARSAESFAAAPEPSAPAWIRAGDPAAIARDAAAKRALWHALRPLVRTLAASPPSR